MDIDKVIQMERIYSIDQVCEKLGGISRSTVETWLSAGRLKRTKIGRRTMVSESELCRFVASCQVEA